MHHTSPSKILLGVRTSKWEPPVLSASIYNTSTIIQTTTNVVLITQTQISDHLLSLVSAHDVLTWVSQIKEIAIES